MAYVQIAGEAFRGGVPTTTRKGNVMASDNDVLYDAGHVLEVDFELKSGSKNPHGGWKIPKATMRVDVTGLTRKDIEADLLASWKIKRARCRAAMSRDEAYKCMTELVHWSEVGKVAGTVDHEVAFHAKFSNLSQEEQEEKLRVLTKMMKKRS